MTCVRGDADAAFRNAPYVRRERFAVQRHTAVTMELRGLLAEWDADQRRLTVSGAAKLPFFTRRVLAKMMSLPEDAVVMVENDVGGGFGVRGEFYPEDFLIPFAARRLGRPVKWIEDRREHLMATNHAREVDCDVEIACRRDGKILGLRGTAYVNAGAYLRPSGMGAPHNVVQFMSGPYSIPHIHLEFEDRGDQQVAGRNLSGARPLRVQISSANGSSTWPPAISASMPSTCADAISLPKPRCLIRSASSRPIARTRIRSAATAATIRSPSIGA